MDWDDLVADALTERAFEEAGLACLTRTNPLGFRCGYVALPAGHALFGKGASEVHAALPGLDANGDLTYADGFAGLWLLGWDAGHLWNEPDPSIMDEHARALCDGRPGLFRWGEPGARMVDADEAEGITRALARRLAAAR